MKKCIVFLIVMVLIPCSIIFTASLLFDEITIGNGNNTVENNYMGKNVLIEINGLYKSMDVEEYVLGVLPGTISPEYDEEALKTQAVLIRTNVLKEMLENNTSDAADLSYQYLSEEERRQMLGELHYQKDKQRFERAVAQTAGKVIKQEDSLIMALYHEVSIGKTASAKEIMDKDISYLQSVDSPQDVEAKHYMNIITYSWQELREKLQKDSSAKEAEAGEGEEKQENEKVNIAVAESTENGFVKKVTVEGNDLTGEEAMQQFGLSSTNFYVEEMEGGIRFVCLGKGNCLGVSLYGANYLALQGKTYEEIIQYYYKDVVIANYK
ncbi:MAG: SpoIID/LytB domain-containing protein [Lachnospiraceae bacterium]|nr:SpoIID/LytB domain-containing protein [Lachnospiraceae bacterium]